MKKFFKLALIAIAVLVGALYVLFMYFNVSYELRLACEGEKESWIYLDGERRDLEKENANAYIKINKYRW